jgi:hypothetical protein
MSVTFQVLREDIKVNGDEPTVVYLPVYPDSFDPEQVIVDPEYGPLCPENPWSINVTNENAVRVLQLLGQEPYSDQGLVGTICDLSGFIKACDNALAAISSFPSLDAGVDASESFGDLGFRIVHCGLPADYFSERVGRLRELAQIAIEVGGILSFA